MSKEIATERKPRSAGVGKKKKKKKKRKKKSETLSDCGKDRPEKEAWYLATSKEPS